MIYSILMRKLNNGFISDLPFVGHPPVLAVKLISVLLISHGDWSRVLVSRAKWYRMRWEPGAFSSMRHVFHNTTCMIQVYATFLFLFLLHWAISSSSTISYQVPFQSYNLLSLNIPKYTKNQAPPSVGSKIYMAMKKHE